jgi:hypothetical protein
MYETKIAQEIQNVQLHNPYTDGAVIQAATLRLKTTENKALRRKFGPKRDEVTRVYKIT